MITTEEAVASLDRNRAMTKTPPPARYAPLYMTSPLATYSLNELSHRYQGPAHFNVSKHYAPAYRRAIKKELLARSKAEEARIQYQWRSTGKVVVVGPPVAAFRF